MKDLKLKIGTPDEVLWTTVKKESEMLIKQSQNNLTIQKEILKLAKEMIEYEKARK